MDIITWIRPKNFQVHKMCRLHNNEYIPTDKLQPNEQGYIEYFFGGNKYIHRGTWPMPPARPGFSLPVRSAVFLADDSNTPVDCTELVRMHSGPNHPDLVFDKYVMRPHFTFSFFKVDVTVKWVLKKRVRGKVMVMDVLGNVKVLPVEPGKT